MVLSQTPSQVGTEPSLCLSPPYSPLCLRTGFLCLEKLVFFFNALLHNFSFVYFYE